MDIKKPKIKPDTKNKQIKIRISAMIPTFREKEGFRMDTVSCKNMLSRLPGSKVLFVVFFKGNVNKQAQK